MKRSFTGPFWFLLVLGLVMLFLVLWYLSVIAGLNRFPRLSMWRLLILPTLVLSEALVYWLIRRRNEFYALSWAHCGIFLLSFVLNVLFTAFRIMHYRYRISTEVRVNRQIAMNEQIYFFWALVVIAHLAFAVVLVNCFRKAAPLMEDKEQGQENILDDVVL